MQGRESAMKMLRNMLQERCEKPRENPSDFFDYVIEELKKEGTILTEAIALDLIFALLFAIKFLSDNPSVLKRLTVSKSKKKQLLSLTLSKLIIA